MQAESIERVGVEELTEKGERTIERPSVSSVSGIDKLRSVVEKAADSLDVTGFKCSKCNLSHSHDTMKHRLSDTYDVSVDDLDSTEYNSVCHCGLHEAARRGREFGIDERDAASKSSNAPIPSSIRREMNTKFGSA